MSLKLKSRQTDGVIVVDMIGRITGGEPQMLLRETVRRCVADGNHRLVLNLSEVNYVDSSGLGELISSKCLLAKQGGQVNLLGLTKRVKDLLVMTRLVVEFESFDDEAKAVAALQEDPHTD